MVQYKLYTSVDNEHISKVLLGRGVVPSKVYHTATNTGSTVASTTFDTITCDVLPFPLSGVYNYKKKIHVNVKQHNYYTYET